MKQPVVKSSTDNAMRRPVYVPRLHNPQENVRPGADDHKKYASLPMQAQAVYHRGHV